MVVPEDRISSPEDIMGAQDDFNAVSAFVEFLGLEGDEADSFVKSSMTRKGHKPVLNWADSEESNEDKGDFFSAKRKTRDMKSEKRSAGWQYDAS